MITHTRRHGDHGSRCQGATETGSISLPRCLPTSRGGKWNCAPANRSEGEISQTAWIGHQVPSACGIVRAWDNMTRNIEMGPRKADQHPYSTYEDPPAYGTPESASIPRTYIHCTLGPFSSWMAPFASRARRLESNVHTMATGHDITITHPNELADVLRIANK